MTNPVCPRYTVGEQDYVWVEYEDPSGDWCRAADVSILEARIKELEAQLEEADDALSITERCGELNFCTDEEREFVWGQEEKAITRQEARKRE